MFSNHNNLLKKVARYCCRYFYENLEENSNRREELLDYGLTADVIEQFKIGYASGDWTALTSRLAEERDYVQDSARTIGVIQKGRMGDHDLFRNRYVLPIFNSQAEPVGFTSQLADSLKDEYRRKPMDMPVLNSSHSPIFNKNNYILGGNQAIGPVKNTGKVYVTDSPVDVPLWHSSDRLNVVYELIDGAIGTAPLGTQPAEYRVSAEEVYRLEGPGQKLEASPAKQ